jgi:hypothetical protein
MVGIGIVTLIVYGWGERERWVSGFGRIAESKRGLKDDIEMVA